MAEPTSTPALKQDDLAAYRKRFQEGRELARYSTVQVGEAIGKSAQAIWQFENGKQRLDIETFVAACDAMHLRVEWVLKGIGRMFDGEMPEGRSLHRRGAGRKRKTPAATPVSE